MVTAVLLVTPLAGLDAMAVALLPVSVILLPVEQVLGLLHWAAQFTVLLPVSAASQAWVLLPVFTARR
jgi:hypothetical protein